MGLNTVNTILLGRVMKSRSQTPWHLQRAGLLPGLEMVHAKLESYISSVSQHLGDYDPRGRVSRLLAHPHGTTGGPATSPRQGLLGTRLLDSDRSWGQTLGVGWPGLQL